MNVKWLIEDGVFPEVVTKEITDALYSIGANYKLAMNVTREIDSVAENDFYIPYGSVGMVQGLSGKVLDENFGVWYIPEFLSWGAISKHWNKYLLNCDSEVVGLGEFKTRLSYFYDRFGKEFNGQKVLFIKPFENDKSFTGMILLEMAAEGTVEKLVSDNNYFEKVSCDTKVVVSQPMIVLNEWRFFILKGDIIAASQYNKNRAKYYEEGCSEPQAVKLVEKVISIWEPDQAFSLDICESNEKYYIMEVGCINCSDLYAANKVGFFRKMTEAFSN